jgi:ABC-2 type transport system ATP-binding protein
LAQPALEIEHVTYAYSREVKALDDVSFAVPLGSFMALLGPNGAGKTTLMSLVTRLFESREGRIRVCGLDLRQSTRAALSKLGVVFQRPTVDVDLTVDQNLRYAAKLQGLPPPRAAAQIDWALEHLGVADRRRAPVRTLSGGLRRRVELARALLHEPQLLILDEPTVGLDIDSRRAIVEHVHALCRERDLAVLWTTHLIDEIWPEDRIVVIDRGRVRAEGTIADLCAMTDQPDLGGAYRALTGSLRGGDRAGEAARAASSPAPRGAALAGQDAGPHP